MQTLFGYNVTDCLLAVVVLFLFLILMQLKGNGARHEQNLAAAVPPPIFSNCAADAQRAPKVGPYGALCRGGQLVYAPAVPTRGATYRTSAAFEDTRLFSAVATKSPGGGRCPSGAYR
jgi:hypothetical protein